MLPKSKIIITPDGNSIIEGEENSELCYKLSDLGRIAGEVTKDEIKGHPPTYQNVSRKA